MGTLQTATLAMIIGSLSQCGQSQPSSSLELKWHQMREMPNNLVLRLENSGTTAACVPDVEVKESISFTQSGREVGRFWYHNRAILQWRDADLISGMIVVPAGRSVDIYYDLNEWMLKRGGATASIDIPEYDCLEFFRESAPRATHRRSRFNFDAPLSIEPVD